MVRLRECFLFLRTECAAASNVLPYLCFPPNECPPNECSCERCSCSGCTLALVGIPPAQHCQPACTALLSLSFPVLSGYRASARFHRCVMPLMVTFVSIEPEAPSWPLCDWWSASVHEPVALQFFYNFVIATTEFSDIHYTTLHIAIKPRANMAKHISLTHGI